MLVRTMQMPCVNLLIADDPARFKDQSLLTALISTQLVTAQTSCSEMSLPRRFDDF